VQYEKVEPKNIHFVSRHQPGDKHSVLCPNTSDLVTFDITGPGTIVGVDNGNMDSLEPYVATQRSAFRGQCLVIVQSTGKPGTIRLNAESPGLSSGHVQFAASGKYVDV